LDIIAVTDHNSCKNVRAVMEVAAGRLTVIPGMEVQTSEEVHVVCYFPTLEAAEEMDKIVTHKLPKIKNEPEIFGHQYYMDSEDEIVGEEEILLVNSVEMDIYEVFETVKKLGGAAVPAHIDRTSYSLLANLGFVPPDLSLTTVEITAKNLKAMENEYKKYNILTSSDAHYLENIQEPENIIDICNKNAEKVIEFLCKKE